MSISKIKTVGRQPLNAMVYENIKKAITEGVIKPGTRLTETKVGEQMNVSTTPVREAFRRLESERLVKIIPYRGALVQEFSIKEIDEVYQCRGPLEGLAVELAIDNISEAGVEKLSDLIHRSNETLEVTEYINVNASIHELFLEYAKNDTLTNMLRQLTDVIYHSRQASSYSDKRRNEIHLEHLSILKAVKERDKEQAKKVMKQHVENGYQYIKDRRTEKTLT